MRRSQANAPTEAVGAYTYAMRVSNPKELKALLLLPLGCVTLIFMALQFGFGLDSTRTLEIGPGGKAIAIFIYAPVALFTHCFLLLRDAQSPNSEGARLRLRYPKYWLAVGAGWAALVIAATVVLGLEICAMLAPGLGGRIEHSIARVQAVRDSAEVYSRFGLQLNCSRYIELEMSNGEPERLCYRRRRKADALSAVEPLAGDYVSVRTRSNSLSTFVEGLTPAANPSTQSQQSPR